MMIKSIKVTIIKGNFLGGGTEAITETDTGGSRTGIAVISGGVRGGEISGGSGGLGSS